MKLIFFHLALLVAAIACTGCPQDPVCPDCMLSGGDPCGAFTLKVTVPNTGNSFTAPKLVVNWTNVGAPTTNTLPVGTPLTSEPWNAGQSIQAPIKPSDFPAAMCDIPKNGPAPFGAWQTANAQLVVMNGGVSETWPVKLNLVKR